MKRPPPSKSSTTQKRPRNASNPDSKGLTIEKSKHQIRSVLECNINTSIISLSSSAAAAASSLSPIHTPRKVSSEPMKPTVATASMSPLMRSLEIFRSKQSARAHASEAAVLTTPSCLYCCKETSRDHSSPHYLRYLACGHVACATCCSKISASQNVVCPLCRCNLMLTTPVSHNSDGTSANTALVTDHDGTFVVIVNDGDHPAFRVHCCWETKFGEILDVIAPHRALEFDCLPYPRDKLGLDLKIEEGGVIAIHESHTLADIGYEPRFFISVRRLQLPSVHQIVTERVERYLSEQNYPSDAFTLTVRCYLGLRGVHELKEINKEMKLFEVVHRLKEEIRSSGIKDAEWYGREDVRIDLFGSVDFAVWDQQNTSLYDLSGQGYGPHQGILYFQ